MFFLAQIDLAEVSDAVTSPLRLPDRGSLAFFVGGQQCAVVHVEDARSQTSPPADAPNVLTLTGEIATGDDHAPGPRSFPYWPLDLTPLPADLPEDPDDDSVYAQAIAAAVSARVKRRAFFLSVRDARKLVPDHPLWWHTAQILADKLEETQRYLPRFVERKREWLAAAERDVQRHTPKPSIVSIFRPPPEKSKALLNAEANRNGTAKSIELIEQQRPQFERFVVEVRQFSNGHQPFDRMTDAHAERLRGYLARCKNEFSALDCHAMPQRLEDLETDTLIAALSTPDDADFIEVPSEVRALINEQFLLPTDHWHQMFGRGAEIQGGSAAMREDGNIMLLQLVYDDLMRWRFGDIGAYQFWIKPADFERQNWQAVTYTFECH
jgi:hypothetical protein